MAKEKVMIDRNSEEVLARKREIAEAKRAAEIVTLREWYDTTPEHSPEIQEYMKHFTQLGRLGKELHKRGVKRVTERLGDDVRTLVEATYKRADLDLCAPLCAFAILNKISE
ncbi:hypothetical protein GCM10009098_31320 [Rheinheimera aquimaris]|uniref:Uncharacterized protein n=1 Tax=Rheinheimera aquimaris TaxID=412437 RepID=A0ABP3PCQ8_9GAMM|nr:hypothetical protein [Rheinheimera aquimaris]MCB5215155.1 hypothetical protein [Rheinheimera aquimaris]